MEARALVVVTYIILFMVSLVLLFLQSPMGRFLVPTYKRYHSINANPEAV
jgi:hypothetical protein